MVLTTTKVDCDNVKGNHHTISPILAAVHVLEIAYIYYIILPVYDPREGVTENVTQRCRPSSGQSQDIQGHLDIHSCPNSQQPHHAFSAAAVANFAVRGEPGECCERNRSAPLPPISRLRAGEKFGLGQRCVLKAHRSRAEVFAPV